MPEDASLDDFLPGDDGDDGVQQEEAADGGTTGPDSPGEGEAELDTPENDATEPAAPADDDATVPAEDVEPASPTSRWSPGEDGCEACGGAASRLWRDGDRFVCTDCKSWGRT